MFWSQAAGATSNIDQVIEDPEVTLQKVLEQEEILQELRAGNRKLSEYLTKPESLHGMIDLITSEPLPELPILTQYKLPNIAVEVLTYDNTFIEKITSDKTLLEKLFHFFRTNVSPINPLLSSYICRVLGEIITRKLDQNWYSYQLNLIQVMSYLQSEVGVLSWLLGHLDCSAVCEFFNKLIINVEGPDMRTSLYEWLVDRERIFHRFVEKMTRSELEDVHANVARLIGDLLYAFQDELINSQDNRASDADPFLQALKSHETICTLLQMMFAPDCICETSIVHGLELLLSLLGVTKRAPRQSGRNDTLDEDNQEVVLTDAVKQELIGRMETLRTLLESPVDPTPLPMTYGLLESPVGLGRLAIAKFIAHLFTLNDDELNMGMVQNGVLKQLLDLFWANPWNNFLHRYVCKIMTCIANSSAVSPGPAAYLLNDMQMFSKIIDVFENQELKVGYRGHLAQVASVWTEAQENQETLKEIMGKNPDEGFKTKWETFCGDTLENYLSKEKTLLAGVHPPVSGGILSSPNVLSGGPYDSESSLSGTGLSVMSSAGAMQWLGSGMLNSNFDAADSLLNLTIGGMGDDDTKPNKSLFDFFCDMKNSTFDDDDDDEDDGTMRKKSSFDLGSPDSNDSLEGSSDDHHEDEDEEMKDSTPKPKTKEQEDDIFSRANSDGLVPPSITSVLGEDPWSNQAGGGGDQGQGASGDEVWCDSSLVFGQDSSSLNEVASEIDNSNGDWAAFGESRGAIQHQQEGKGEEQQGNLELNNDHKEDKDAEEWADFQSPVLTEESSTTTEEKTEINQEVKQLKQEIEEEKAPSSNANKESVERNNEI